MGLFRVYKISVPFSTRFKPRAAMCNKLSVSIWQYSIARILETCAFGLLQVK